MPIYARTSSNGNTKFKPCPEGTYAAICTDVWEPWAEESKFDDSKGQIIDKTRVCFIVNEVNPETDKEYEVSQVGRLSIHPKSKFGQMLPAWRGKSFADDEARKFDWETLIGKPALLSIVHNVGANGRVYANISAIMPLPKGMVAPSIPKWYVRHKDKERVPKSGPGYTHPPDEFVATDDDVPFGHVLPALLTLGAMLAGMVA
jgi:hypothetical protein